MSIIYPEVVDGSTINEHTPSLILLRYEDDGYNTRTHALSNMALLHQLIHLPLKLFGFLRIGSICRFVWNQSSRDEVDLMLNPFDGRQPFWSFIGEDILEFLQNKLNTARQSLNVVRAKKKCLLVKEHEEKSKVRDNCPVNMKCRRPGISCSSRSELRGHGHQDCELEPQTTNQRASRRVSEVTDAEEVHDHKTVN
ncbi:unnamed protein product [Linum trigynum]|uniref:Uncharacterized protein n=1 Tax=Linum trigynum TaxID=586398 RepID=A0AAV2EU04_9ROSI